LAFVARHKDTRGMHARFMPPTCTFRPAPGGPAACQGSVAGCESSQASKHPSSRAAFA